MEIDNLAVGHNIAKFRKLREIKAHDIALHLGIKEATYSKYERGETAITIDFLKKVGEFLNIDPVQLIAANPNNFFESLTNSPVAINGNSTYQTTNDEHTALMLNLMKSVLTLNERLITLLDKKE
jgi:transcriptional regulator with XRE-family HTH domain